MKKLPTGELIDMTVRATAVSVLLLAFVLSFFVRAPLVKQIGAVDGKGALGSSVAGIQSPEVRTYSPEQYKQMISQLYGLDYMRKMRAEAEAAARSQQQQQQAKQQAKTDTQKAAAPTRTAQFPNLEIAGISRYGSTVTFQAKSGSQVHFLTFRKGVLQGTNPWGEFIISPEGKDSLRFTFSDDSSQTSVYGYDSQGKLGKYATGSGGGGASPGRNEGEEGERLTAPPVIRPQSGAPIPAGARRDSPVY